MEKLAFSASESYHPQHYLMSGSVDRRVCADRVSILRSTSRRDLMMKLLRTLFSRAGGKRHASGKPRFARPRLEAFEERCVPATFTITKTDDAGGGTLRAAIDDVNASTDVNNT